MISLRTLVALYVCLMMLPVSLQSLKLAADCKPDYLRLNDEIALSQLREQLLYSYDLSCSSDCLYFRYEGRDCTLSLVNGNLLLQPGTVICLSQIDTVNFTERAGCIYLCYERKGQTFEKNLAKAGGLHLAELPGCDDDSDGSDGDGEQLPSDGQ